MSTARDGRLDEARFIAAIAVILIHVMGFLQEVAGAPFETGTFIILHSAFRWAVPWFVLISGAVLLLPREEEALPFWRKRFGWFIPFFLFWTLFYTLLRGLLSDHSWRSIIGATLSGRPFLHLWYLYLLPGLYLITPALRAWLSSSIDWKSPVYFAFFIFAMVTYTAAWDHFAQPCLGLDSWPFWFISYLGYFVLGPVIVKFSTQSDRNSFLGYGQGALYGMLTFSGLITTIAGNLLNWPWTGYNLNYCSISVAMLSVGLFGLWLQISRRTPYKVSKLISPLLPTALGVYILHPFFLSALRRVAYLLPLQAPIFSALALWLLCSLFSVATVLLLQRIPILRRVV